MAKNFILLFFSISQALAAGGPQRPVILPKPKLPAPAESAAQIEAEPSFEGKPTLRIYQVGPDRFRFESCNAEKKCEAVGREEGYSKEELERWEKFRKNTAGDILPMMAIVAAVSLLVGSLVFFPLTATVAVGAVLLTGFAYLFSQTPQVQAGMPNDVYKEFDADPTLVPQLKTFLREVDEGLVTTDANPRVFSGNDLKSQSPAENKEEVPALPAK